MKTRSFKLCGLIIILMIGMINSTYCQTTYSLSDGKVILESGGDLFDITYSDTILIDKTIIMVKYAETADSSEIDSIEQVFQLTTKSCLFSGWKSYYVPDEDSTVFLVSSLLTISTILDINFNCELKFFAEPISTPNDPYFTDDQWYISNIHVDDAWDITTGDPNLVVGILDNGVDYYNQDLQIEHNPSTLPYPYNDTQSHGTFMSAIIAAKTNNGYGTSGIAGGWNSSPVKISMYKLNNSIDPNIFFESAAMALFNALCNGIRLFNFSWGCSLNGETCETIADLYSCLTDQIKSGYESNAIMLAAVGNFNETTVSFPACLEDYVIAVGGTGMDDNRWYVHESCASSYGERTFISAPAESIIRPVVNSTEYVEGNQTSPACAIATGVTALMLSVNPCLSNEDAKYIIQITADKTGNYDYNWNPEKPGHSLELGYGKIDAFEAVQLASNQLITVTQNTIFTTPQWFTHDLTIEAGATLTINSVVKFSAGTKIYVKKGGHLIVNGGTLTTDCPDFWGGIELESDPDLPQTPTSNQGYLTLLNNAVIEKANFGVKNYIPDPDDSGIPFPSSYGGGIIWAEDAMFLNCGVSVSFGQYPDYQSSSQFHRCSFIFDYHYPIGQHPTCFINLGGVDNVKFYQCTFDNQGHTNFLGNGIQSMNSTFYVDGICSTQQSPCPKESYNPSVFHNLAYGVYALNTGTTDFFDIKHSEFTNNYHGIYASAVDFSSVTSNSFSIIGNNEAYGLYFENSTGYHIEDNTFIGDASSLTEEVGLYIRNSGYEQNWVYNNWFNDLYCGAIADGINRRYINKTGLCFKCNDFARNTEDIFITKDEEATLSADHSIAFYQGQNYSNDTMPAGNTFSENSAYSIDNAVSPIFYYYHQHFPFGIKVEPIPITTQTVGKSVVSMTFYGKERACPSWLNDNSSSTDELISQMDSSESEIGNAKLLLSTLTDGGNTEELNSTVTLTGPDSSYVLYNLLLSESPFLSDTVMKSSIQNEMVLPNAMIRDILVANPQSAKSSEVMTKIDERFNPMPDEMLAEIQGGINIIGKKDSVEREISSSQYNWGLAFQRLQRQKLYDTSNSTSREYLKNLYYSVSLPEVKYKLYSMLIEEKALTKASSVIDSIPVQFELSTVENVIQDNYESLNSIFSAIISSGKTVFNCDNSEISGLLPLVENQTYRPGAIARNILIGKDVLQYSEPVNLPTGFMSGGSSRNPNISFDHENSKLSLFPNPAGDFIIADYHVSSSSGSLLLQLSDLNGKILEKMQLISRNDQIIIQTKFLKPGMYMISIVSGKSSLTTSRFIKN